MATYGLTISQVDVPELPEGVDNDTINYKDDFMETADVFGFVPVKLTSNQILNTSGRAISQWVANKMSCDELAIGQIEFMGEMIVVNVHSSKVSLALKAFERYEFDGQKILAAI